ncbi:hypothetical protein FYM13_03390 [Staphylococcus aureus]|nr:hypothetical protein FYM10_03920 [Staphylococcus aureus]TYN94153.1 hypothetical protein FYM11_03445 [Staphylococcus aureus]TYO01126.1 hypothetical protein FYM13_03390 [Staphylococcus aureus]TYO01570.1 hypothetical protein FYM19_03005 [Staphylococcus aureus]TYO04625.1 hypothetical protein FYM33_05760 [Staphylococcus aureus]
MHEFYSCIPIFKYTLAVANDKKQLHNKSLVALYHFCPTPNIIKHRVIKPLLKLLFYISLIISNSLRCS